VRRLASQFVLAIAVTAAMPLIDAGPRASADHIGAKAWTRPDCSPLSPYQLGDADLMDDDLGMASSQPAGSSFPSDPALRNQAHIHILPSADLLGQPQQTGGFGSSSTSSGANSGGQQVGLTIRPQVPELDLAGNLFLDSTRERPRAFPSCTFRPPREVC
jgi:hypothetical protein